MKEHHYQCEVIWEGNRGLDTSSYTSYSRAHSIRANGKNHEIQGSSDPAFRGNPERYNPEELFLSSLSSCHMLWYLHLCSEQGILVESYTDEPRGIMQESENGSGKFISVTLFPKVVIRNESHKDLALTLHKEARKKCFIANSCNFEISHSPSISIA